MLRRLLYLRYLRDVGWGGEWPSFTAFCVAHRKAFPDSAELAGALRHYAGDDERFHADIRTALYGEEAFFSGRTDGYYTERLSASRHRPNSVMLHLAALAGERARDADGVLHTFNFDSVLDDAARRIYGSDAYATSPMTPRERRGLQVAHLHGVLDPVATAGRDRIVLTAGEFHRVRSDPSGWTYGRMSGLFEGRSVLLVGLSMADANLRQVMDLKRGHEHFLVRALPRQGGPRAALELRTWRLAQRYWEEAARVEFVALDTWSQLEAFLLAVRHEVSVGRGVSLWQRGWTRLRALAGASTEADLWDPARTRRAATALARLAAVARAALQLPASSRLSAGMFVPTGGSDALDLPFRSDLDAAHEHGYGPGYRQFRATIDEPGTVAGVAYARGGLLSVCRDSEFYRTLSGTTAKTWDQATTSNWQVLACSPVYDWAGARGAPIGIGYLASDNPPILTKARSVPIDGVSCRKYSWAT